MLNNYHYTDSEIKQLLKSIVILTDTREQENKHIINYFDTGKIAHKNKSLNVGDYSFMLPAQPDMQIARDIYFTNECIIERKNSLDEIANNLSNKRIEFENEFLRGITVRQVIVLIEDIGGYTNILNHNYRTQLREQAFLGSVHSLSSRYNLQFIFLDKQYSGIFIYHHFYHYLRNWLLNKIYK